MLKSAVDMLKAKIHNTTAKLCDDIEQPTDELKDPHPARRVIRLVTIAVVGAFLAAATVVMALRIPKLQSEKKTFSSNSTQELEDWLNGAATKNHIITCPCQTQVMSWCNVTTFHLYKADNKDAPTYIHMFNFSNEEGGDKLLTICSSTAKPFKETICKNILSPVLNYLDSRTFLSTASAFIDPDQLYNVIAMRIDTNAFEESSIFSVLQIINQTESYNYSQALTNLVRTMVIQFKNSSSSSSQDYWIAANPVRQQYNMTTSYGMEVSWQTYLQICNPPFCDEEFPISAVNRVLRAMGQVGGITSLLGLVLKFLIWPLVVNIAFQKHALRSNP